MQIKAVRVHNFRSIVDVSFDLEKYALLVGENNAGKTNVITALRIFYENDIKYDPKTDFPKCSNVVDQESWIELEFLTSTDEQDSLKNEYRASDMLLKVRKYLKSSNPELVKSGQSNIYAYESGVLSTNLFYGAKNISNAKLGKLLYIPELSKTDDNFKMSGPSPFRDMIDFIMQKRTKGSKSFEKLQDAFDVFNTEFKKESATDGFSIKDLTKDINDNVSEWGINFGLDINNITTDNIIKNLISHYLEDKQLNNERVPISSFGQGMQRHLIYTLIKIGSKYVDKKEEKKKEFSPDLTIILFEEPEAFLHPTQQEILNQSLKKMADDINQQVLCTTHSPIFVSKNVENLPSLLKVIRRNGESKIYQVRKTELNTIIDDNNSMFTMFTKALSDNAISTTIKGQITRRKLGDPQADLVLKLQEESLKYFLWLDGERSCSFFAKHVFICEGASEKVLLDYLLTDAWADLKQKHIYFLDVMGKFNIHRYMNLFGELGIYHTVLYDKDADEGIHNLINSFIVSKKNAFTKGIYTFDPDFEGFLGIPKPDRADLKPLNILFNYKNNNIADAKITDLKNILITNM